MWLYAAQESNTLLSLLGFFGFGSASAACSRTDWRNGSTAAMRVPTAATTAMVRRRLSDLCLQSSWSSSILLELRRRGVTFYRRSKVVQIMTMGKKWCVRLFLIEMSARAVVELGRLCMRQQFKREKPDCASHPKDFRRAPSASRRAGVPRLFKSHS